MYDIIVVGGGHAGCEAANASAKKGHKTLLMTSNLKNIADMPCNPHIGGSAKGIVVREIDALGGLMGKVADKTHLQIKMLNSAKGPAVQSLRAQGDKIAYPKEMLKELNSLESLEIKEAMVEDLIVEDNTIKGIVCDDNRTLFDEIKEEDFRYSGPIPSTKEAAIIMLADSVEAVIAAIYFDSDLEHAEKFIVDNLKEAIELYNESEEIVKPKVQQQLLFVDAI